MLKMIHPNKKSSVSVVCSGNLTRQDDLHKLSMCNCYLNNVGFVKKPKSLKVKKKRSSQSRSSEGKLRTKLRSKSKYTPSNIPRPKTAGKKIMGMEYYKEVQEDNNVTFNGNDVDCFFDAVKESVEEVFDEKFGKLVDSIVRKLASRFDDLLSECLKTEHQLNKMSKNLEKKISQFGEEHSKHLKYICMRMEYDKILFQHFQENKLPINNVCCYSNSCCSKNASCSPAGDSTLTEQNLEDFSKKASPVKNGSYLKIRAANNRKSSSEKKSPNEDSGNHVLKLGIKGILDSVKKFEKISGSKNENPSTDSTDSIFPDTDETSIESFNMKKDLNSINATGFDQDF